VSVSEEDYTEDVTHSEFVSGLRDKTIGFKLLDERFVVRGARRTIFNILVMLYTVAPLIIVPLFAFLWHSWGFLTGIIISYAASFIAANVGDRRRNSMGCLLLLVGVFAWWKIGLHNVYTFLCLCALWGFMVFHMAEESQREYATQSLCESPELYHEAVSQKKVW
jgi:hypothetical protein